MSQRIDFLDEDWRTKKNNYQNKIPSLQSETCQGVCLLFDIVWRSLATPTQHMLRVIIYIVWNFKTTYPANSYIEMKMMKCLGAKAECSGKGGWGSYILIFIWGQLRWPFTGILEIPPKMIAINTLENGILFL